MLVILFLVSTSTYLISLGRISVLLVIRVKLISLDLALIAQTLGISLVSSRTVVIFSYLIPRRCLVT
jgi:hypothetical protein